MPGLDMLDVAIGVVFMYLLVSLVCSAAAEFFEALARFRARDLEKGIQELLDDPALVRQIYDHALVNGLFEGKYPAAPVPPAPAPVGKLSLWQVVIGKRKLPSYIPSRNFALALLDEIGGTAAITGTTTPPPNTPPAAAALPARPVIALPAVLAATNANKAVVALVAAAKNDAAKARENVEEWFNSSMDRVSGWYKRRTQYILFALGLVAAVAFNLDSIGVAKALATNKKLRDDVVGQAMAYAKSHDAQSDTAKKKSPKTEPDTTSTATMDTRGTNRTADASTSPTPDTGGTAAATTETKATTSPAQAATQGRENLTEQLKVLSESGLPVGWKNQFLPLPKTNLDWLLKILGLLITACAVSLGAPFWFDMLNKIIVVRSTVKPKEKSGTEGSKEPK